MLHSYLALIWAERQFGRARAPAAILNDARVELRVDGLLVRAGDCLRGPGFERGLRRVALRSAAGALPASGALAGRDLRAARPDDLRGGARAEGHRVRARRFGARRPRARAPRRRAPRRGVPLRAPAPRAGGEGDPDPRLPPCGPFPPRAPAGGGGGERHRDRRLPPGARARRLRRAAGVARRGGGRALLDVPPALGPMARGKDGDTPPGRAGHRRGEVREARRFEARGRARLPRAHRREDLRSRHRTAAGHPRRPRAPQDRLRRGGGQAVQRGAHARLQLAPPQSLSPRGDREQPVVLPALRVLTAIDTDASGTPFWAKNTLLARWRNLASVRSGSTPRSAVRWSAVVMTQRSQGFGMRTPPDRHAPSRGGWLLRRDS